MLIKLFPFSELSVPAIYDIFLHILFVINFFYFKVVVDVSYIYGMSEMDNNGNIAVPYDDENFETF